MIDKNLEDLARRVKNLVLLTGNFEFNSGIRSKYKVDVSLLGACPELRDEVIGLLWNRTTSSLIPYCVDWVVGCGYGGSPLVSLIGSKYGIKNCVVKGIENQKKEGAIEGGSLNDGEYVAIVDDVFTTGGTMERARRVVEERGAIVTGYIAVFNWKMADRVMLDSEGNEIPLVYLFTPKDFGI